MPRLRVLVALRALPLVALLLVALLLIPSAVTAQPAEDASARALALGREALDLYAKNDFTAAFEKLRAADQAAHSPVFVLYMARCRRGAGDLLAARALFASIAGEGVPAGAPEPWQRALDDAQKELGALDTRIPSIVITVRGASPDEATVTLDEAPIAPAALRAPLRVNPGAHTIVARASGGRESTATVRVAEGDPLHPIDLTLTARVVSTASTALPIAPITPPIAPGPRRGSLVPGFIGLGVGVAGLGVGIATGLIATGTAADIKKNCIDGHCLASDKDRADGATTLATVSTASFIVGGAAAAAGVVLILVRPGGSRGPDARLVPGAGSLSLVGSF